MTRDRDLIMNPFQADTMFAELPVESETMTREPPPPYSPHEPNAITNQPGDGEPGNGNHNQVIHQTIIVQPSLKHSPIYYNCPKCQQRTLTTVKLVNTKKTHMMAGFICGFTCWCLICCLGALPYFLPTFKEAQHYCSNCDSLLGKYSKI